MAFSYDDSLSTDRDKVRFYIRDTTRDSGPLPNDANLSNDEIDGLVTAEGSWQRAIAGAFEVLTAAWAGYADWQAGPRRESASQVAERYQKQAEAWRGKYGQATTRAGVRQLTRVDGYSDDVASDEV